MIDSQILNLQIPSHPKRGVLISHCCRNNSPQNLRPSVSLSNHSKFQPLRISRPTQATRAPMEVERTEGSAANSGSSPPMKLLFVEMGVGYDQHGCRNLCPFAFAFRPFRWVLYNWVELIVTLHKHRQDITAAAMRACRDAISSNSIPAFRRGSIPGVSFDQMKLQIKLGVPHCLQQSLDIEKVKSVFPYGKIVNFEVVDGGLICSSGVHVEEMGDKNDDCYIVNAAVYVGY